MGQVEGEGSASDGEEEEEAQAPVGQPVQPRMQYDYCAPPEQTGIQHVPLDYAFVANDQTLAIQN